MEDFRPGAIFGFSGLSGHPVGALLSVEEFPPDCKWDPTEQQCIYAFIFCSHSDLWHYQFPRHGTTLDNWFLPFHVSIDGSLGPTPNQPHCDLVIDLEHFARCNSLYCLDLATD